MGGRNGVTTKVGNCSFRKQTEPDLEKYILWGAGAIGWDDG